MASTEETPSVYCSTSGTFFTNKDDLAEHYKSDYHRYNLKRKIADLPPVTKEWFDSRKDQLTSTAALAAQKTWVDPLTKKRFASENTYTTFINSKKYQDLVKKSGKPAPEPYVTIKRTPQPEVQARQVSSGAESRTHIMKEPFRGAKKGLDEEMEEEEGSEWETASEEDEQEGQRGGPEVAEWDVRRSLFDNHVSADLAGNLEYMWKKFGFYLPDAEFLQDPDGLIKYLGAKLAEGNIPLYASGLDVNAKQLGSLQAVQQHMVDTNQCKMVYDGVEDEYADYYDYTTASDGEGEGMDVVMAGGEDASAGGATGGYELAVGGSGGGGGKILGSRDFARYYRQNHRPVDGRRSTHLATVQQRYRNMGVALLEGPGEAQAKRAVKQAQKQAKKGDRIHLRTQMRDNVNRDLPRNVPY